MTMQTNLLGRRATGVAPFYSQTIGGAPVQTEHEITGEIVAICEGPPPPGQQGPWYLVSIRNDQAVVRTRVPLDGLKVDETPPRGRGEGRLGPELPSNVPSPGGAMLPAVRPRG